MGDLSAKVAILFYGTTLTVSLPDAEGSSSSSQNEASSTYAICFAKRSALLLNGCSFASVGASNAEGSFRTT